MMSNNNEVQKKNNKAKLLLIFITLLISVSKISNTRTYNKEKNNLFLGTNKENTDENFAQNQINELTEENFSFTQKTTTENSESSSKLLEQISENDFYDFNPNDEYINIPPFSNKSANKRYNLDENRTKCMDGSKYGVYHSPGYDKGKNKLLIGFEGMNWCYGRKGKFNPNSCKQRTNFYWGSSNSWKDEYIYDYNEYGGDERKNAQFFNWNRFIIPYCDGTGNQGHKSEKVNADGTNLYFNGFENTLESLKFIFKHVDLKTLEKIVVFGCSSGGWAALQWMHLIENYIEKKKSKAKVMGIFAGGYFINYKNKITKDEDYLNKIANMYDFVNKESPAVNKECLKDHKDKPYLCLMPEILLDYVKSPIILFQAQYDSYQIDEVLGEKCVGDSRSLKNCKEADKKGVIAMRDHTMDLLKKAVIKKKNLSIFSPACVFHCFESMQRSSMELTVGRTNIDSAMSDFIDDNGEKQVVLIDQGDWPSNSKCANS